jgi:hypothetical protein
VRPTGGPHIQVVRPRDVTRTGHVRSTNKRQPPPITRPSRTSRSRHTERKLPRRSTTRPELENPRMTLTSREAHKRHLSHRRNGSPRAHDHENRHGKHRRNRPNSEAPHGSPESRDARPQRQDKPGRQGGSAKAETFAATERDTGCSGPHGAAFRRGPLRARAPRVSVDLEKRQVPALWYMTVRVAYPDEHARESSK